MKKMTRQVALLFALTREERIFIAGLLAIGLVGIAARYRYLQHERPEPYQPAGVQVTKGSVSE